MRPSDELSDFGLITFGHELHRFVREVLHPAGEPETLGFAL